LQPVELVPIAENLQPLLIKRGKACNSLRSERKRAAGAKRGENMQVVPSAGKQAAGAKRGKTCKLCQVWENACKPSQNCDMLCFLFFSIG